RGLAFASEPRALLASGFAERGVSAAGLSDYLSFGYVPAPRTIFPSIAKLKAAERAIVTLDAGTPVTVGRYWTPEYRPEPVQNVEAWLEEFHARMADAVRTRLESDVPLGAFLSGGLDSTVVVQQIVGAGVETRTFTIGFDEPQFDESRYARAVAEHFRTIHTVERVRPTDLLTAVQRVPHIFDE